MEKNELEKDKFQMKTGYQNLIKLLDKNTKMFHELAMLVSENLYSLEIRSTSPRPPMFFGRQKIGVLKVVSNRYLAVILPKSVEYRTLNKNPFAFPNDTNQVEKTRILDSQTWAKYKLADKNTYPQILRDYLWIEFLDWVYFKYATDTYEIFVEKILLTYS